MTDREVLETLKSRLDHIQKYRKILHPSMWNTTNFEKALERAIEVMEREIDL